MFLIGVGLLVKELATPSPDPVIVEIGAGLVGVPGILHHRILTRTTESGQEPIQQHSQQE